MSLNASSVIAALNSMNVTANCSISISWLEAQGSTSPTDPDNSINVAFLRTVLPPVFLTFSNQSLFDFYGQLAATQPSLWYAPTVENIQKACLAPQLASSLSFEQLDLTKNCSATAAYYSNVLCAINGPRRGNGKDQPGWTVDNYEGSRWMTSGPPSVPINGTSGLTMIREALPSRYMNISDVELQACSTLASTGANNFTNKSQTARVCEACISEFCTAAAFTGNPDIAGIGAFVSYLIGASLLTLSFIFWVLCKISDLRSGADKANAKGLFRMSASSTLGALAAGTIALALSMSVALLVLLARRELSTSYEQIMAENATYISFYMLMILGSYFPLSSFKGADFATTWMALYYIFIWIQTLSFTAVVIDAINTSWYFGFGDMPCLRAELGGSPVNSPLTYSILFLIFGGLPRLLLLVSFTFKALMKWFQVRDAKKVAEHNPATKLRGAKLWLQTALSDTEGISLMVAFPFFIAGLISYASLILIHFSCLYIASLGRDRWNWADHGRRLYKRMPTLLDSWFKWASYGAWVLSFLSIPLMWFNIAFVVRVRHAMGVVAGDTWSENQVGFGQVLALLIWAPVILGFALSLAQLIFHKLLSFLALRARPGQPVIANNNDVELQG